MNNIDVFEYIASNEPRKAKEIIKNFGGDLNDTNIANSLRNIVNKEGEDVVEKIMNIHPDYSYFQDIFNKKTQKQKTKKNKFPDLSEIYNKKDNSVILLACTMIITIAIITKK